MRHCHLIRVGAFSHIGRFWSTDATRFPRRSRVIVRTARGLEVGEVLAPPGDEPEARAADGQIIRGMTDEDELLLARLEKHRADAFDACCHMLRERNLTASLIDVEHLFDGQGLYFYFMGEITPEIEALTADLADIYDARTQFRRFAETLSEGCGPDCGTEDGGGNCGSCVGCVVAVACGKRAG